jgi:protein SCO1/2
MLGIDPRRAALLALTGACLALASCQGRKAPTPAGANGVGGPFALVAPDGSTVTDKTFAGKPFAIYFGYTRCPDVCPTSLSRMARLRKALGAAGDRLAIIFVSVDPEHDKPKAIGEYVKLFGTPIIGLTGSEAQLKTVEHEYGVYVNKVPQKNGDYLVDHSAATLLFDRQGQLADIITPDQADADALAKLRALVS